MFRGVLTSRAQTNWVWLVTEREAFILLIRWSRGAHAAFRPTENGGGPAGPAKAQVVDLTVVPSCVVLVFLLSLPLCVVYFILLLAALAFSSF